MSHYSVAVMLKNEPSSLSMLEYRIDNILAPYDESLSVPRYIAQTKAEIARDWRHLYTEGIGKDIEDERLARLREDNSDECWWEFFTRDFDKLPEDIESYDHTSYEYNKEYIDKDGNFTVTYNPKSKWDWYEIGGRYSDVIDGNIELVKNLPKDFVTYAFVDLDGNWHEPGRMGWFGVSSATEEELKKFYDNYYDNFLNGHEDCFIVIVDCHI